MHSRIFQLSAEKLPKENWIDDLCITDYDMGYFGIDYCGETDYYDDDLKWLKQVLPKEVFKVKGRKIEIVSDGSCLFDEYKNDLLQKVQDMSFSGGAKSFLGVGPFGISYRAKRIIETDFLFRIDDFGGLGTTNTLVEYAHTAMHNDKYPKTLYINGILDYHL